MKVITNYADKIFSKIYYKLKNDIVLLTSIILAIASMFFVKPNVEYFNYIDYNVIVCLFCLMLSISGLERAGTFRLIANITLKRTENTRITGVLIILITFFSSMFITNDVALIAFVPFCLILFKEAGRHNSLIKVITLQTIAANLGSMFTPFGNPQNLFLYSKYKLTLLKFIGISYIPTILGLIFLLIASLSIKSRKIIFQNKNTPVVAKKKVLFYLLMFIIALMPILHVFHYLISFIAITLSVLIFDRRNIKHVDYGLLITFVAFFIFIGNIVKIEALHTFLNNILDKPKLLYPISVATSQLISNVPAAILLSGFTSNFKTLILGVNIGGCGTLIASLANIISYNFYIKFRPKEKYNYLKYFLTVNCIFLILLFSIVYIISQ